jgi:hypothetical protein
MPAGLPVRHAARLCRFCRGRVGFGCPGDPAGLDRAAGGESEETRTPARSREHWSASATNRPRRETSQHQNVTRSCPLPPTAGNPPANRLFNVPCHWTIVAETGRLSAGEAVDERDWLAALAACAILPDTPREQKVRQSSPYRRNPFVCRWPCWTLIVTRGYGSNCWTAAGRSGRAQLRSVRSGGDQSNADRGRTRRRMGGSTRSPGVQ